MANPDQQELDDRRKRAERDALLLLLAFRRGDVTALEFVRTFEGMLRLWHADAWMLGQTAGGATPTEDEALAVADSVVQGEKQYLAGLQIALQSEERAREAEATEPQTEEAVETSEETAVAPAPVTEQRVQSYSRKMTGTANSGLLAALPDGLWDWELGDVDHCADCPALAANGPYRTDELPTVPGNNDTECLFNCCCWLVEVGTGTQSFRHTPGATE